MSGARRVETQAAPLRSSPTAASQVPSTTCPVYTGTGPLPPPIPSPISRFAPPCHTAHGHEQANTRPAAPAGRWSLTRNSVGQISGGAQPNVRAPEVGIGATHPAYGTQCVCAWTKSPSTPSSHNPAGEWAATEGAAGRSMAPPAGPPAIRSSSYDAGSTPPPPGSSSRTFTPHRPPSPAAP